MANIYPYLDLGTWEAYTTAAEVKQQSGTSILQVQKSATVAHAGGFSGKGTFLAFPPSPGTWYGPNFFFELIRYTSNPRSIPGLGLTFPLTGRKFKVTAWVYIPSGSKIASNDATIYIGPEITNYGAPIVGGGTPLNATYTRTKKTIAECLDVWTKFEYEFTPLDTSIRSVSSVAIYVLDSTRSDTYVYSRPDHQFTGTMNPGGELFIDDISFEEIAECNLAAGTPAFNKTNETVEDADDGTITANNTSTSTIEYSLDNATWQTSNVFTGLAPGLYTLYVRDSAACTLPPITDIQILAGEPIPDPPEPVPGPLTVNQKPLNRYNFVNWFPAFGPTNYTLIQTENCNWDLPKGYDRQGKTNMIHAPVVVPLEDFAFYINADIPFNDPDFSTYRLGLFDRYGMIEAEIGTLQKHDITPGTYNIYASVVNIPAGIDFGFYYMMIYRQDTSAIIMASNPIELMSLEDSKAESVRLQFKHGYNFYKYYYELVPLYINKIRLRMYRIDEQFEGELVQYRAVSSGRLRNVSFELDKKITLECYYFDDLANRAMGVFQAHGFMTVNDYFYLPKTLYKWAFDAKKKVMKGTIELFEQDFSTANRYAPLTDITVIGSDDPLLLGDGGFIKL